MDKYKEAFNRSYYNCGDLNPDPFHLTIAEARYLASKVDDPDLNKDIDEAMWSGDDWVPIARKYEQLWRRLKH